MRQMTFSSVGFEVHHKQTRREQFLSEMDAVVPWQRLCVLIEPHYPSYAFKILSITASGSNMHANIHFMREWSVS